jgi:hypothetical protein
MVWHRRSGLIGKTVREVPEVSRYSDWLLREGIEKEQHEIGKEGLKKL